MGTNTNINADIADCTFYDNCANNIAISSSSHAFNPVFTFFLIFATVSLFYHFTTKTDLSLFEEFLRISQEHNFNNFIQSIQSTIQNITDGMQITNDDATVINEPLDINISNADVSIANLTPVIKFEDKFLIQYLALKSQATLTQELMENLANNFVMEHSPNGNIIMFYDYKRGSFGYYADNVIPYRFLEVLGRKYVCTFQCPSLYHYSAPNTSSIVDTVEITENVVKETELHEVKEEQGKLHITAVEPNNIVKKKPVFANFKSYNKDTSNKVVTKDTPTVRSTNSSIHTSTSKNNPDTTQVITNRYTCHGKICNMQFLKKIDRTIVDKNYKMSFADFKRLKITS